MRIEKRIKDYKIIHQRLRRKHTPPNKCSNCNAKGRVDLANKSGKYLDVISDWDWLCRKCHMLSDGRMNNLLKGRWAEKTYCLCGKQAVTRGGVCMKKYNCLRRHAQPCIKACQ